MRFFALFALCFSLLFAEPVAEEKAFGVEASFAGASGGRGAVGADAWLGAKSPATNSNLGGERVVVGVSIDPSVFIYADKFQVFLDGREIRVPLPEAQILDGASVFCSPFSFEFSPREAGAGRDFALKIELLGCSYEGFCYRPQSYEFRAKNGVLVREGGRGSWGFESADGGESGENGGWFNFDFGSIFGGKSAKNGGENLNLGKPNSNLNVNDGVNFNENSDTNGANSNLRQAAAQTNPAPAQNPAQNEVERIAANLANNAALAIAAFFGYGVLLSLTPCTFVMIPILSQILVARSGKKPVLTALVYVVGMACAYALGGVAVSLGGINISAMAQNPAVIGIFALLFVAFAANLFGAFELPFLAALNSRIDAKTSALTGFGGVFVLGFAASVALSPCVAAPIAAAMLFMLQNQAFAGSVALGAAALFAMGCGMGALLVAFGFGAKFLPRPGEWMERVKCALGFLMLAMAVWVAQRLFAGEAAARVFALIYAALGVVAVVFLGLFEAARSRAGKWFKVVLAGVFLWCGVVAGGVFWGRNGGVDYGGNFAANGVNLNLNGADGADNGTGAGVILSNSNLGTNPAADGAGANAAANPVTSAPAPAQFIAPADIPAALAAHENVILYFWAHWCENCKKYEKILRDREVQSALGSGGWRVFKVDLTHENATTKAVKFEFGVFAPPTLIFFRNASEQGAKRLVGTTSSADFVKKLQN